jgi:hypothetical protein
MQDDGIVRKECHVQLLPSAGLCDAASSAYRVRDNRGMIRDFGRIAHGIAFA